MELKELFQKFANMSHEERVEIGSESMTGLAQDLTDHGLDRETAFNFVHLVVSLALSADRVTAADEYRLFVDITGADVSYEDFYDATNIRDLGAALEHVDKIVDQMTETGKHAALTLALCFLSADDKITPQEQQLFAILLA